jgi:hypothetical protein
MSFIAQADRQYAEGYGQDHRQQAWVLSDRDVWYANPYYIGPAVPHPEDDADYDEYEDALNAAFSD